MTTEFAPVPPVTFVSPAEVAAVPNVKFIQWLAVF